MHWLTAHRYSALTVGAISLLTIWSISLLGWLELPGLLLYDRFLASGPTEQPHGSVLLIEVDASEAAEDQKTWLTLLQRLHELGARQIALEFLPNTQNADFYGMVHNYGIVVVANVAETEFSEPEKHHWKPLPSAIVDSGVTVGLLAPPPPQYGIYRSHRLRVESNGEVQDSFLSVVARNAGLRNLPEGDLFFLDLDAGSVSRLPKLFLKEAVTDSLVEELVRDRTVLVTLRKTGEQPLYTPIGPMPASVYDALALENLIRGHDIRFSGAWLMLSSTAAIIAASLFVFQWVSLRSALWMGLALGLTYTALAWLSLHGLHTWPPLMECMLAQILIYYLVYRQISLLEQQSLHNLATHLKFENEKYVLPSSFYEAEDYWTFVADMVNQVFDLQRVIFLERVAGDHRLKEIKALNCGFDDIDERRRDYKRTPYSTAIDELSPIRLQGSFLKRVDSVEIQYLAPLIYGGEVLGFWAVGVMPENIESNEAFLALLRNLSEQLGYLLHVRREWQRKQKQERNIVFNYLRFQGGESSYKLLKNSVVILEKRLSHMKNISTELESYFILYDWFGRILAINRNMENLAKQEKLRIYGVTLADLMTEITNQPISKVRVLMQSIIFLGKKCILPVTLASERHFLLNLKLLRPGMNEEYATATDDPVDIRPFQMQGVLFEMIEITSLVQHLEAKDEVFERTLSQVRNSLATLLLKADQVEQNHVMGDEQYGFSASFRDTVNALLPSLNFAQTYLRSDLKVLHDNTPAYLPVDGLKPLDSAVAELPNCTQRFDVAVRIERPESMRLVVAAAAGLQEVFGSILGILAEDTVPNGIVRIKVEQSVHATHFLFVNEGFGLPAENLRACLDAEAGFGSRPFTRLRQAISNVQEWGGKLTITSRLSEGFEVSLTLNAFL